ncbi:MAG: hypothetical protein COV74_01725 [Candidatus Omnitrophica bacterium CG11_big_fil_rev_8_21_14_0_20_45_26]|uniref:Transcriptional regulator n=1 Tax=Candidatus Abzuiibacterium crystallinum TaxID=1974748 RepID=A0A2H0LSB9_9BACT|nr:MAG: hypothetical protein COV74_01725 [Candidatus Omnitrophica bacterium CG11_big_fil_rev_8_21_14_0_20_45_26]PIW65015.1 MAG: hypothetical protein COW12_04005 [Candidatus Omnitrophica bacterium CG12_big_fil_rev_8_21_14_0_65_45_16]
MNNLFNSVLIVDDEKNTRDGMRIFLESKDYDVWMAANGTEALETAKTHRPDLALIDLRMPEMDGLTLLRRFKELYPAMIVIVLTAYGTVETAVQAMKAGAYYYLSKPVNLDELEIILKKAFRENSLEQENKSLRQELLDAKFETNQIIGQSEPIQALLKTAKQVAESDATVLIEGESGTGKELLAHAIHQFSRRRQAPFVTVHCGALTESLLSSELFGHEKGAFTGASERKTGRFERAHGGTLFLDEIGEITETTQIKLLRFLQSGEYERVGSAKTLKADVRLICATNKILKNQVQAGKFREDLFYRINVILLRVPSLRERKEDIEVLAQHFIHILAVKNRRDVKSITPRALKFFQQYDWPGNIRELRNIIERMIVLSKEPKLDVDLIPSDLISVTSSATSKKNESDSSSLSSMEKNWIERALRAVKGNKSLAAKKLGISRRTLYRKLEEYGLNV